MYSPEMIERRLFQARQSGLSYTRLPRERSLVIAARLEKLRYNADGVKLLDGQLVRPLDKAEREFIASERLICKADFSYYAQRYHYLTRDPGVGTESGIGPAAFLESQKRVTELIGRREEECYAEYSKYRHTAGILCYIHKSRQVAITDLVRRMTLHRMLFWPGTRCFGASLSEDAIGELYRRDKIAVEGLPFWLAPTVYPDVKNSEIGFDEPLNTRVEYRAENESTGIGTGSQFDLSHLTEVSLWRYLGRIRYSFMPSLPRSLSTLHVQEATSSGKGGYWQDVTEGCRSRRPGFEDWTYIFIPAYTNTQKYRKNPPASWTPNEHTRKYIEMVRQTSPEFTDGHTYTLTREQSYWWETERELHAHNNELASFLANFPATPQQSFTNWAQGALPIELIEKMELSCLRPRTYVLNTPL